MHTFPSVSTAAETDNGEIVFQLYTRITINFMQWNEDGLFEKQQNEGMVEETSSWYSVGWRGFLGHTDVLSGHL
jgi:hypothetical protein